jgi:hypothetical protein
VGLKASCWMPAEAVGLGSGVAPTNVSPLSSL